MGGNPGPRDVDSAVSFAADPWDVLGRALLSEPQFPSPRGLGGSRKCQGAL